MNLFKRLMAFIRKPRTVVFAKPSDPPLETKDVVDGEVIFAEPFTPKDVFEKSNTVDDFIKIRNQIKHE